MLNGYLSLDRSVEKAEFAARSDLIQVELLDGAADIADYAFHGASGLQRLMLPNTLRSIGDGAFSFASLKELYIPDSVRFIGAGAFEGCEFLERVRLPDCVISVGAFSGCRRLERVEMLSFPDVMIFGNCPRLREIVFRDGSDCRSRGTMVYRGNELIYCSEYAAGGIALEPNTASIGKMAFYNCEGVTGIEIPNTMVSMGSDAFRRCVSLKCAELPDGTVFVSDRCFRECRTLEKVGLPQSLTRIGSCAFEGCSMLYGIDIPKSVYSVGASAFSGCESLEHAELSEALLTVRSGTFAGTALRTIVIPDSAEYVGRDAFADCESLAAVSFSNDTLIRDNAFVGCSSLRVIIRRFPGGNAVFPVDGFDPKYINKKPRSLDRENRSPIYALFRLIYPYSLGEENVPGFVKLLSDDWIPTVTEFSAICGTAARSLLPKPDLSRLTDVLAAWVTDIYDRSAKTE